MKGCLGCLGLVVVLALIIWPIDLLGHLFGWSDFETGEVELVWFGLVLVGASVRQRRSVRRGSGVTAGRVRGDGQRRADVVGLGRTLEPAGQDQRLSRWRLAAGRPAEAPGYPSGLRGARQLDGGPANGTARLARRSLASFRDPIPARLRFDVLVRDGFRCRYCGRTGREPGVVLHIDHVVPVAAGGSTSEDNLLTACAACNLGKSTRPVVPPLGRFAP